MATQETLQIWLIAAESAYNSLLTGTMAAVIVDQNGERVEYSRADAVKLAAYIQNLKLQLGQIQRCNQGPMRVWM